jgi:hypothetical protein
VDPTFIEAVKTWGLPLGMTLFVVLAGARGWWFYKATVDYMQKNFQDRLAEKNDLIAQLQAQGAHNSQISAQALDLAQKQAEVLLRIEAELKRKKAGDI